MKSESGFTLISVLIAMVMLSVGVVSLTRTIGVVASAHTAASTRSTALAIAQGHMEQVRSREAKVLVSEPPVRVNDEGDAVPNGRFTRTVEVVSTNRNLRQVTVRVDYPRARKPVELVTLTYVGAFGK